MRKRGFEIVEAYKGHNVVLPQRKSRHSAGYDISLLENVTWQPQEIKVLPTGLKAYMQPDEYLGIFIRSSIAVKQGLCLINGQGIIDSDYYNNADNEGHIMLAVFNSGSREVSLPKDTRVAQGIFYKYLSADDEDKEGLQDLRSGGFGSTGER